jgi:hypothetical protein
MKMSAVAIEALLREDRLAEGDEWFLVSSWWWRRALGPVREADTEADGEAMALTDEDSEGSAEADAGAVADAEDAGAPRVANEGLLEVELSSRRRGVAVLRPMLVRARVRPGEGRRTRLTAGCLTGGGPGLPAREPARVEHALARVRLRLGDRTPGRGARSVAPVGHRYLPGRVPGTVASVTASA